jgi:hypothetical protein
MGLPLKELGSRKLPTTISIPSCDISANLSTFDASVRIAMRANFDFWFKNSWATMRPMEPLAPMRRIDWEDMLDIEVDYGFVEEKVN